MEACLFVSCFSLCVCVFFSKPSPFETDSRKVPQSSTNFHSFSPSLFFFPLYSKVYIGGRKSAPQERRWFRAALSRRISSASSERETLGLPSPSLFTTESYGRSQDHSRSYTLLASSAPRNRRNVKDRWSEERRKGKGSLSMFLSSRTLTFFSSKQTQTPFFVHFNVGFMIVRFSEKASLLPPFRATQLRPIVNLQTGKLWGE